VVYAGILEDMCLGASDIHIHTRTMKVGVRTWIKGIIKDKIQSPSNLLMTMVSRIKFMA